MKLTRSENRHTPIGLDIRDDEVFGVQFAKAGEHLSLNACVRRAIAPHDTEDARELAVKNAIESLLKDDAFSGRKAISALGTDDVDTRPVVLPAEACDDEGPEFAKALLVEATSCLLYSPEDAVLNYIFLDQSGLEDQSHTEVLLIASQKERVKRHLKTLKRSGARITHVDSAACAAVRLLGDDDSAHCVIELDSKHCIVSIGRGRDLQFSRAIKFGTERIIQAVAAELDVTPEEAALMLDRRGIDHAAHASFDAAEFDATGALNRGTLQRGLFESCRPVLDQLAVEIRRSISYFGGLRSATGVTHAVLAGGVTPKGLPAYLQSRLEIPVTVANAFAVCGEDTGIDTTEEYLYVRAAGLALRDELS